MKVLVVTVGLPYPLSHGGHLRLYNLLDKLSHDHDLYLLSLEDGTSNQRDKEHIDNFVEDVYFEKIPDKRTGFFQRIFVSFHYKNKVVKKIKKLVVDHRIDIIHYHYPDSASFGLVPGKYHVPQVLDNVDSTVLLYRRNMNVARARGIVQKIKHFINSILVVYRERQLTNRADISVVVSPTDAQCLNRLSPSSEITVIPNGVNSDYFSPRDESGENESDVKNLIFVGNMDFLPNIHAVTYFVEDVFPLLKKKFNSLVFLVVGKNPVESVTKLGEQPGVKVLGFVDDVRQYYEKANVVVIPMVSGGGIKNKVLEAFAMGRPVVATSLGMEAIDIVPDVHTKIGNEPAQIAEAIIEILESPNEGENIARNARILVESKYSWDSAAHAFNNIYIKLTGPN